MTTHRNAGKYSPSEGLSLPSEPFTGTPDIPCPEGVCPEARAYWESWARSEYGHAFRKPEWQNLADTTKLAHHFYVSEKPGYATEMRQREAALFGLATRARLHIKVEEPATDGGTAPMRTRRERTDPRLKAI